MTKVFFVLFAILLTSSAQGQDSITPINNSKSKNSSRSFSEKLENLQVKSIDLYQESDRLQKDLLFPAEKRLELLFTSKHAGRLTLKKITIKLDGNDLLSKTKFSPPEWQALTKGGSKKLYIGTITQGSHTLTVLFRGKQGEQEIQAAASLSFSSRSQINTFNIKLRDGKKAEVVIVQQSSSERFSTTKFLANQNQPHEALARIFNHHRVGDSAAILFEAKLSYDNRLMDHAMLLFNQIINKAISERSQSKAISTRSESKAISAQSQYKAISVRSENQRQHYEEALFYKGKILFNEGAISESIAVLQTITDALPREYLDEYYNFFGQVLMTAGQYKAAAQIILKQSPTSDWTPYGYINLALIYNQLDAPTLGLSYLDKVRTLTDAYTTNKVDTFELKKALKDRANMVAATIGLSRQDSETAIINFQKVRLNGPFSNSALLGFGWAAAASKDYRRATQPWLALSRRPVIQPEVQESFLALGYIYEEQNLADAALDNYQNSLKIYGQETLIIKKLLAELEAKNIFYDLNPAKLNSAIWQTPTGKLLNKSLELNFITNELQFDSLSNALADSYRIQLKLEKRLEQWSVFLKNTKIILPSTKGIVTFSGRQKYEQAWIDRVNGDRNNLIDQFNSLEGLISASALSRVFPTNEPARSQQRKGLIEFYKRLSVIRYEGRQLTKEFGQLINQSKALRTELKEEFRLRAMAELTNQQGRIKRYSNQAKLRMIRLYDRLAQNEGNQQ